MKVIIFGATGMLGSMVYQVFRERYDLILILRDTQKAALLGNNYGSTLGHKIIQFDLMNLYDDYLSVSGFSLTKIGPKFQELINEIGDVDAVINCVGIIKPHSTKDPLKTLFINGAVPHILSMIWGPKLIHITTDCVYNGLEGAPYDENSSFSPNDLYGLSKRIGEPSIHSLVLRTSIIGPEITGGVSLISWLKKQEGQKIRGFTNHYWNGITTREYAKVCDRIISNRSAFPSTGLYHIFSSDISKYDMLMKFKEKYHVQVDIEAVEPVPSIDRRLRSIHYLSQKFQILSFGEMLNEL